MRIGIDGRFVQGPNTGVTNYLINLLKGLSRIDRKNTYSVFLSDPRYNDRVPGNDNFCVIIKAVNPLIWKNFWLPSEVRRLKIDLVHFPAYTGAFVNTGKNVVTIHDLIHRVNPRWFSRKELMLMGLPVRVAVKKATGLIAVSQNTKRDIIRYYGVSQEKIAVTLEAADDSFRPISSQEQIDSIKDKYGIKGKIILYVGVLFKRRNVERLIEAFSLLKRDKDIPHKLVIVGPGRKYFDLEAYLKKYGVMTSVIYLGYVPQPDMPSIYNAADFFVYPSLYEGFGLPVLEAMSCGKAVITSNTSSLPEVVGDAGILIDPYSIEELRKAMRRLATDSVLKENLGRTALERSKIFSWDKMAEETIAVYEKTSA